MTRGPNSAAVVEKVITGPGSTSLEDGEVIEAITLPKPARRGGDAYLRFTPRTEMDIAVVGVGISLSLERGAVEKAVEELRGGAQVNDPNSQDTRQALEKYTIDLTERAEQGKIDPSESTVAYITGNGLKTTEAVSSAVGQPLTIDPKLAEFQAAWERAQSLQRATWESVGV